MRGPTQNILIIQTNFQNDVSDVISFIQLVKEKHPNSSLHFVLSKGNEDLLKNNLQIDRVWNWNQISNKLINLLKMIKELRNYHFEYIFNLERFFFSKLITLLLKANHKMIIDKRKSIF